jgi:hypothetical protein
MEMEVPMAKLALLTVVSLSLCSCATALEYAKESAAASAWNGQPEGARSAFARCMYEVSESQCGNSDVRNPAVIQCMKDQVAEYKEQDAKERWLINKGCDRKRAGLREGDI